MPDIPAKPWRRKRKPKRILAIRLQATGDVVITLPYLQQLRNSLPEGTIIDMLTREETQDIPRSLQLFDRVYAISGGRNYRKIWLYALLCLPRLFARRYDVVIDLQNNEVSRLIRKALQPRAWSAFDRFSPDAAGERNRRTIEAAGLAKNYAAVNLRLKPISTDIETLLRKHGWDGASELVILNPAGAFANRNWPIGNYIEFAQLWLKRSPATQFLILGIDKIIEKANLLKSVLHDRLINLVNKTTPAVAFAIVQRVGFVLSEDSGLMHMSWISGIPTLAIFGATRSDWSRPLGPHTAFVDSSDLACGNCMLEHCKLKGDQQNLCMIRYSPTFIFEKAQLMMNSGRK